MAAEKKLAFKLSAGLATDVLTEAKYIQAGYIVVKTLDDRDALVTGDQEVLVEGSPVYVADKKKTYRFHLAEDGHTGTWIDDQNATGNFVFRGVVTYAENLPSNPLEGDIYQVKMIKGTGTESDYEDGHNYFAHYSYDKETETTTLEWRMMSGIDADAYVNDEATTVAIGGIEKGTTFEKNEGWNLKKLFDKMLYPYVPFTFENLETTDEAKEYEYGTAVNLTAVTPSYTLGSKAMTRITVGSTSGGKDLLDTDAVPVSGSSIELTTPVSASQADVTIYTTLTDGTTTLNKESTVTFAKYIYHTHQTSATEIPTTATKGNDSVITVEQNEYVVFLAPDETKVTIQQFANGEWNDLDTKALGAQTEFELESGATVTYYAYRTNKLNAGEYQFRLN